MSAGTRPTSSGRRTRRVRAVRATATRVVTYAVLWVVIVEGDLTTWPFALPGIVVATLMSQRIRPSWPLSTRATLSLLQVLLWRSFVGAVDVAGRALRPHLLAPTVRDHALAVTTPLARTVFADLVGLMPGTLPVDVGTHRVAIHCLTDHDAVVDELHDLERRVAAALREPLPQPHDRWSRRSG